MSYDKLHDGLSCDCLAQNGVSDNTNNHFVRSVTTNTPSLDDFMSNHELGRSPKYPLKTDKARCMWRCVSTNQLNENRPQIREHYQRLKATSPMGFDFDYVCIFRLKADTAKMWATPTSSQESHHSLMKSDDFDISSLDIDEIVAFEDF